MQKTTPPLAPAAPEWFVGMADWQIGSSQFQIQKMHVLLGGGFKYVWNVHPYLDEYFSDGLKPPTNLMLSYRFETGRLKVK